MAAPGPKMTPAQLTVLQADIAANSDFNNVPNTEDGNRVIKAYYDAPAEPDYWVWRTSVSSEEYTGSGGIVYTAVDALQPGKARIFEWLTANLTKPLNPADQAVRQALADCFGANSATAQALIVMSRRKANRLEKLYAIDTPGSGSGRGTTNDPDTMTYEGAVNLSDIDAVRSV